jgi:hypothetical protein
LTQKCVNSKPTQCCVKRIYMKEHHAKHKKGKSKHHGEHHEGHHGETAVKAKMATKGHDKHKSK